MVQWKGFIESLKITRETIGRSFNFDYTRNRILWSTRKRPSIRFTPKTKEQIHSYVAKPRGSYKKKSKI